MDPKQKSRINNEIERKQLRQKKKWSQEGNETELKILWRKKRKILEREKRIQEKYSPNEDGISIEGNRNERKICEWTLENNKSCDNKIEESIFKR